MIRKILDSMHPMFAKGGKFEKLYPLYEAQDTFLYTPGEVAGGEAHVRDSLDLKRMMSMVIVALVPCIFMALYNTGYQANKIIAETMAQVEASAGTPVVAMLQDDEGAPEGEATASGDEKPDSAEGEGAAAAPSAPVEFKPTGWRYSVMDAIGIDYTQAGSFFGDMLNPMRLIACLIHGALFFFPVYIVTMAVGGTCELIFSIIRGHEINEGFLVTGMLFPLTLPPTIPLWQVAIGIAFGVIVGKEIFGGTGKNFLNVALTSRAFLYFAYSKQISGDGVWTAVDGYSSPTVLGAVALDGAAPIGETVAGMDASWMHFFVGNIHGSMGETSTLCALLGAAVLIATGIGSWRIMSGCVVGMAAFSGLLYVLPTSGTWGEVSNILPWWHLVIGGFAFGTVFMATDPVSAAMTRTGKWAYGILIGFMTVLVRSINPAFPEGIMLAILFANVFAPFIDWCVVQANIKRRVARYAAQ